VAQEATVAGGGGDGAGAVTLTVADPLLVGSATLVAITW
jgi:hypothetical protein